MPINHVPVQVPVPGTEQCFFRRSEDDEEL